MQPYSLSIFRLTRSVFTIAALALASSITSQAQTAPTVTTLHAFTAAAGEPRDLEAGLILASDGNFYGTSLSGGASNNGTVFKMTPDGAITVIHSFAGGSEGGVLRAKLLQANDGNFYGTTEQGGGPTDYGTVFKMTPTGAVTTLRIFSGPDGLRPRGDLIQAADGYIYGTTQAGGSTYVSPNNVGYGTIYKISPAGVFTTVASFDTNTTGSGPQGGLIQATDGNFYGTTASGRHQNGDGTQSASGNIFKLTPDGTLTDFTGFNIFLKDPRGPYRLIQGTDGNFYGASFMGGVNGYGTVYKVSPTGAVTVLHSFTNQAGEGAFPEAGLLEGTDGNFYGTTLDGGVSSGGTIFKVSPAGEFTTVHALQAADGTNPMADLVEGRDGNLYGTTSSGANGFGTVFRLNTNLPPPLATTFTVNESASPSAGVADSILRFRATENAKPAGLSVRVQSSTDRNAWTDLPDASHGKMSYAPQVTAYVLSSTNYPTQNGVYFRAVSRAPGYTDTISNVVGPFDLSSATPHLSGPLLFVTTNGEVNAIRFGVKQDAIPSGIAVKIQTTQTPLNEASWTSAPVGNSGQMTQDTTTPDTHQFYLGTDEYPEGEGNYFRAVASAPGYVGSVSFIYGPLKFVHDPAAAVTISVNGVGFAEGNTFDEALLLPSGGFNMQVNASSGRFIKRVSLLFDGVTIEHFDNGATTGSLDYNSNIPGDHIVEAYATDDLGVTGAAPPVHVRIFPHAPGKTFQMTQSGDWNTASNWTDVQGNPGVPGTNDFAVIGNFSPTLSAPVNVNAISLNGGTINGAKLTVTAFCTVGAGNIKNQLTIPSGSTCEFLNDEFVGLSGTLDYAGTVRLHGRGGITGIKNGASSAQLSATGGLQPDGLFDGLLGVIKGVGKFFADLASGGRRGSAGHPPAAKPQPPAELRAIQVASFNVAAGSVVAVPAPAKLISQDGGGLISQDGGGLISQDGGGLVASGAGNLVASGAGNLLSQDGGGLISQDGGGLHATGGGNLIATGGGNLVASGAGNLVASGAGNAPTPRSASAAAADSTAGIVVSGGELDLTGIVVTGQLQLDGGILSGSGLILGDLTNNAGYIAPGHSAGSIGVSGNFAQGPNGTLILENGGASPLQYDQLHVNGTAALGGKLDVKLINGYVPAASDTFNPLGYSSVSGSFVSVSSNAQASANDTGLLVSTNPALGGPIIGQPTNISTRAQVLNGDNVVIGGFIVSGSSPKMVVLRAIAPSLAGFGVAGSLADPKLDLYDGQTKIATNDNWRINDATNQSQEGSIPVKLRPTNELESVIVATLEPNHQYTAIVRGNNGATGVALFEAYDVAPSDAALFSNISTRGVVGTNDNVMIGGFIVAETGPGKVIVRGIGPSLTKYGVPGALQDPVIKVYDTNGNALATNDDWKTDQASDIQALGRAPDDTREATLIITLPPGSYTAILSGKDGSTGVGLVEIYSVQ